MDSSCHKIQEASFALVFSSAPGAFSKGQAAFVRFCRDPRVITQNAQEFAQWECVQKSARKKSLNRDFFVKYYWLQFSLSQQQAKPPVEYTQDFCWKWNAQVDLRTISMNQLHLLHRMEWRRRYLENSETERKEWKMKAKGGGGTDAQSKATNVEFSFLFKSVS